ncbi:hypothetical protein [Variovorax sp. GB1P17]|uniref:hypothetical protein n=1 Tax=Variovorax sp. GB1P17 TaxID=3443740 RepID=UPI003F4536A2
MTTETISGWVETIPAVEIELMSNGNVRVTDKSDSQQDYSVDLHPIHLRLVAEKLGLVRDMSATEADALRVVDRLGRRLRLLQERIDHLDNYLVTCSDHGHADLTYEMAFSAATLDLVTEFCRELDESGAVVTPRHTSSRVTRRDERKAVPVEQLDLGVGHD